MAHHYVGPADGKHFLPQMEVLSRITESFSVHTFDQEKGKRIAERMISQLEIQHAPAEIIESYRTRCQQATNCYLSDDRSENCYLTFTLWPDEPIFIGYHSPCHEEESRPLLQRLATILGYDIQL